MSYAHYEDVAPVLTAQTAGDLRIIRIMGLSSYSLLIWDYLLTLNDEIRLIWPSRWSTVKILFLLNRYGNLILQAVILAEQSGSVFDPSNSFCFYYNLFKALYQFAAFSSVHALILIRAWAISQRSRKIATALIVVFAIFEALSVALEAYGIVSAQYTVAHVSRTCTRRLPSPSNATWLIWVGSFALEFAVFLLNITSLSRQFPGRERAAFPPIVRRLYRDSGIFFLGHSTKLVASKGRHVQQRVQLIIFAKRPRNYMADLLSLTLVSITGQRLALGLRQISLRVADFTRSEVSKEIDRQIGALSPMASVHRAEPISEVAMDSLMPPTFNESAASEAGRTPIDTQTRFMFASQESSHFSNVVASDLDRFDFLDCFSEFLFRLNPSLGMPRKLSLSLPFFSKTKDRPPTPPPKSPPLSTLSLLQSPVISKFTESDTSAILGSEGGGSSTVDTIVIAPTIGAPDIRTSSKLHKLRKNTPVTHVFQPAVNLTAGSVTGSDRSVSFSPSRQSIESFTEDHRLRVGVGKNPSLVLLEKISEAQYAKCGELLQTSLSDAAASIRDIIPQKHGFVQTVVEAYNNHRGLIVRPDDVWLSILVQFSFFVNGNAELLRANFVSHEGKQELTIFSGGNRYTADFALMSRQMTDLMHDTLVDPALREWIMPAFTTTTLVDTTAFAMVMMSTMKEYFSYKFVLRCGIPRVTLEGEKRDWESILSRLDRLKTYGIQTLAWYHLLHPIISQFVTSFDRPDSPENIDFWNKVAHFEGGGSGPTWLSGWITAFCVFNEQGQWQGNRLNEDRVRDHEPKKLLRPADPLLLTPAQFASVYTIRERNPHLVLDGFPYPMIDSADIPCGYAHLNVKLDDNGELFDTVLVAGTVGSQICSGEKSELFPNGNRDTVRPVTAWWYFIER
ncbi:hypothetical protein BV22DRAFT_1194100 [Leucogyrophana mollusca]|uniref:Uncharacterized protein n=1 Tax=Leucogyrophana mollusca TaxID=85980 RepID=A0ACB8BMN7_9AGAM|nr:hypothetical protein BV22DRAFT_1194100 [Leucogyrophana mollusca]